MTVMSGLGIVLSLVFGCLLLALVAELYYLLWWKKQRIVNTRSNNRIEENYSNHAKEMLYLFCWDKPSTVINNNNNQNSSSSQISARTEEVNQDIEMGFDARKDLLLKALGEDGVDSDIVRLAGHPRFLFTIKEETKEDLESDDGKLSKKGSRTKSLSDLIMAIETQTPYISPLQSPNHSKVNNSNNNSNYDNPLFEASVEAEMYRLKSSPPPKFKFLRDAEEKLYRRLVDEAKKSGVLNEVVLGNSDEPNKGKEWGSHLLCEKVFSTSVENKQVCLH